MGSNKKLVKFIRPRNRSMRNKADENREPSVPMIGQGSPQEEQNKHIEFLASMDYAPTRSGSDSSSPRRRGWMADAAECAEGVGASNAESGREIDLVRPYSPPPDEIGNENEDELLIPSGDEKWHDTWLPGQAREITGEHVEHLLRKPTLKKNGPFQRDQFDDVVHVFQKGHKTSPQKLGNVLSVKKTSSSVSKRRNSSTAGGRKLLTQTRQSLNGTLRKVLSRVVSSKVAAQEVVVPGRRLSSSTRYKSALREMSGRRKQETLDMKVGFVLPDAEKGKAVDPRIWRAIVAVDSMIRRSWGDIIAVLHTYEIAAIPLRLCMHNRHPLNDSVAWLREAESIGLPIFDVLVDVVLIGNAFAVTRQKAKNHLQAKLAAGGFENKASVVTIKSVDTSGTWRRILLQDWWNSYTITHIWLGLLYWVVALQEVPMIVFWSLQAVHLPKLIFLSNYFERKVRQPNVNVSTVASFKLTAMIFLSAHYIGLIFYFLCIVARFDGRLETQSWVVQFRVNNSIDVNVNEHLNLENYLLCMYKGLSSLTNLAYESTVPKRVEELILSVTTFLVQMVVEAYILGTLMHYLVKRDPSEQRFVDFMARVDDYCKARNLPGDLHKKLKAFFDFQHQQQRYDARSIAQYLPHTTRVAMSQELYGGVLQRNRFLFRGCNPQFTTMMLIELREEFLMPGGAVFLMGDMARDLYFVMHGEVERTTQDEVLGVLYGEQEGVNVLGDVAFVMSVPHPYTAQARLTGSATLLSLSRTSFDKLLAPYPECMEEITGNLLEEYDMDRKGNIVHQEKRGLDAAIAKERKDTVSIIQGALSKRNADNMGSMKFAIQSGNIDDVAALLREGFDVNTADYDGRTSLHIAASAGDLKIVELLVNQCQGDPSIRDRQGRLPLDDAMDRDHTACVGFLAQNTGTEALQGSKYIRRVCYGAAEGNTGLVIRNLQNGVSPSSTLYRGRTPLHIAARHGCMEVAQHLIREGAAINAVDDDGRTPLMDAVMGGHTLVCQLLRFNKAVLGAKIMKDARLAAMYFATYASQGDITRCGLLMQNGINPDVSDYDLRTAIHVTASNGMLMTVAFLLETCMADANPVDRWGKTPLQDALEGDHVKVAVLLRAHGGILGPSGAPELLEKLIGPEVPTVYDVKKIVNRLMRQQMQNSIMIKDTSVAGGGENRAATYMIIPEVPRLKRELEGLIEAVKGLEKVVCPTLLMLVACFEGMDGDKKAETDADDAEFNKEPDTYPEENGNVEHTRSNDIAAGQLVGIMLKLRRIAVHIKNAHLVFLRFAKPISQIRSIVEFLELEISPESVLEAVAEHYSGGTSEESIEKLFSDHKTSFAACLCTPAFADAVQMKEQTDVLEDEKQTVLEAVSTAVKLFHKAWLLISKEDERTIEMESLRRLVGGLHHAFIQTYNRQSLESIERHVQLHDLSAQSVRLKGVPFETAEELSGLFVQGAWADGVQTSLQELGRTNLTFLTKIDFSQALLHMADVGDPYQREDGDEDDGSGSDVSEMSSQMDVSIASSSDGNQKMEDKPVLAATELAGVLADHRDAFDEISSVLDAAKEAFLERKRQLVSSSWRQKLMHQLHDLLGYSLEALYSGMIFDIACERFCSNERTLDEFWYGVLENILMAYEDRKSDRSAARAKHVRLVLEELGMQFETIGKAEFVRAYAPLIAGDDQEAPARHRGRKDSLSPGGIGFVFHPDASWLSVWKLTNRLSAIYLFLDVSFRIAFHTFACLGPWYLGINCVIELLQVVDVIVCFNTAYYNTHGVLISQPREVRKHYLSNGFFVDLVATLPFDCLMWASTSLSYPPPATGILSPAVTSWLRLPKVLLIARVFQHQRKQMNGAGTRTLVGTMYNMLPILFYMLHISACLWWMCGSFGAWSEAELAYSERQTSWINTYIGLGFNGDIMFEGPCVLQYMLSLYWVLATLVTNGLVHGMHPTNWLEVAYTCLMMLISLTLFAYFMGEISNAVMEADEELVKQRSQLTMVSSFIKARNLSKGLVESIMSQFSDLGKVDMGDSAAVFDSLSNSLQVEVARWTSRRVVEKVPIMSECNTNFLDALVVLLREQVLTRDSYLFRANELSDKLYFIAKGAIEFVEEDGNETRVTSESHVGEVVGELSFLFGMPQNASARSKLNNPGATLYILCREDYKELARLYPEEEERIIKKVLKLHKKVDNGMHDDADHHEQIPGQASGLLAIQQSMEQAEKRKHELKIMQMISITAKGDLPGLKSLVKRANLDINEVDHQRRSPLHIAAAYGHLAIVKHLVDHMNADVSQLDINGVSPLMEAIHHRHHSVVNFLQSKKATLAHESGRNGEVCELAFFGKLEELKLLIENGISPNVKDYDEKTPLHLAARRGHFETVKYLIAQGGQVNAKDREDKTPMQEAIFHGHRQIVDLLAKHGGKILSAEMAYTLCDLAAKDDFEALKALVDAGVDASMQDYDQRSALHLAASNESIMVGNYLLKTASINVDINIMDRYWSTPLDDATRHGNQTIISMLHTRKGMSGSDPALDDARQKAQKKLQDEQAEQARNLALEAKEKSVEMAMIRECQRMRTEVENCRNYCEQYCQMYHKTLNDISKASRVKANWTPHQAARYRRLQDNARYLARTSKGFNYELEMMMRMTEGMTSPLRLLASEDVILRLQDVSIHMQKAATLADKVATVGFKHKFDMAIFRKQRIRKLMKVNVAQHAYESASSLAAAAVGSKSQRITRGNTKAAMMMRKLKAITLLLTTWNQNWRQVISKDGVQTTGRAVAKAKVAKAIKNVAFRSSGAVVIGGEAGA